MSLERSETLKTTRVNFGFGLEKGELCPSASRKEGRKGERRQMPARRKTASSEVNRKAAPALRALSREEEGGLMRREKKMP